MGQQVDHNHRPVGGQVKKASAQDFSGGGYVGRRTEEDPPSWTKFAQGDFNA